MALRYWFFEVLGSESVKYQLRVTVTNFSAGKNFNILASCMIIEFIKQVEEKQYNAKMY